MAVTGRKFHPDRKSAGLFPKMTTPFFSGWNLQTFTNKLWKFPCLVSRWSKRFKADRRKSKRCIISAKQTILSVFRVISTEATDGALQSTGLAPTWVTSSILTFTGLQQFVLHILKAYKWRSVSLLLDKTYSANPWFGGARKAVTSVIERGIRGSHIHSVEFIGTEEKNGRNVTDYSFLLEIQKVSRSKNIDA